MDHYSYPTQWSEISSPRPKLRLNAKAWSYALGYGEVPAILSLHTEAYEGDVFKLWDMPTVNTNLAGDPRGSVDGHHVVIDQGFQSLLETDPAVPVAPCFVRDLAGRAIYVGGPLTKSLTEWEAYGNMTVSQDGTVANALLPFITFPRFSRHAAEMEGADLLEQVLLTRFRMLDMSLHARTIPSGAPLDEDNLAASYDHANLYPYKYRPDTFYIDGYKLPQTVMLYAKSDVRSKDAIQLGEDLLVAWGQRRDGLAYEAFMEGQGGEAWVNGLFEKGCTVIPTFEAANGYHVVNEMFGLEDFWPGRAVPGLHTVQERRADKAPEGTILEVLQPGYVTATAVMPAVVIVSDGTGYVSPNVKDPLPLVPNMTLPHQRTLANWHATWLPTRPLHFEAPALWGFDIVTGHFMQFSGPLWDPLHYYYNCTDGIILAMKKPLSQEQNRWFVPVPQEFFNRFHPIVPMNGFDVHSAEALARRREENRRPYSIVTRVRKTKESAAIGYHPLPMEFEFELDPFWFPTLHPLNREHGPVPIDIGVRIAPVIQPTVSVPEYLQHVNGPEYATWLRDENRLAKPSESPLENYPQLLRFVAAEVSLDKILPLIPIPFLAAIDEEFLTERPEETYAGQDQLEDLSEIDPDIFDAWWDAREKGHQWVRFRHLLYQSALELYAIGWWYGATPALLEEQLLDWMQTQDRGQERMTAAAGRLQR